MTHTNTYTPELNVTHFVQYVGVDLIEADKLAKLLTKAGQVTNKAMKNK